MSQIAHLTWLVCDYNQAESRVVAWKGPVPKLKAWYIEGKDVHAEATRLIAKVCQENHVKTPVNPDTGKMLFHSKHWSLYVKGDEERETGKRTVHAGNYEIGVEKYALITGLPTEFAKLLLKIYFTLFPEIKTNYHAGVERILRATRTIWMPEPVRFRKVFWDKIDNNTLRSAYSCFPQCTVGSMTNRTLRYCGTIFKNDPAETLKDQWIAWYGVENWDHWRSLRDADSRSPLALKWSGMCIGLNVHDSGCLRIPDDPDLVRWAATTWKQKAEETIYLDPKDRTNTMSIPVDFKKGPTISNDDLHDYKLAA